MLGWKPDPPKLSHEKPDFEALPLLRALPPPPVKADIRQYVPHVLDQGQLGSCTAQAVAQAVRVSHMRQGVKLPQIASRLFLYWWARAYNHQTNVDEGTYLRSVFQGLQKFGFCPETLWPYQDNDDTFKKMPGSTAIRAAYDQANPTVYRRINASGDERLDQIKRAIAGGYAVVFGTNVDTAFCNGQITDAIKPPTGNIAGGHAMMVGGYDGDVFDICNSWGAGFGDLGWCRFTAEYMAWSETRDIWLIEHAPKYSG